jgi:hypothetical protein
MNALAGIQLAAHMITPAREHCPHFQAGFSMVQPYPFIRVCTVWLYHINERFSRYSAGFDRQVPLLGSTAPIFRRDLVWYSHAFY